MPPPPPDRHMPPPPDRHRSVVIAARAPRVGRVERLVRRQLIISGALTTAQLAKRIYGSPTKHWHYFNVRRAAPKFAVEISRRRPIGTPIVWKLR
jgi:hypothetical protein